MTMWCNYQSLLNTITQAWRTAITGCAIYKIMQKLKKG